MNLAKVQIHVKQVNLVKLIIKVQFTFWIKRLQVLKMEKLFMKRKKVRELRKVKKDRKKLVWKIRFIKVVNKKFRMKFYLLLLMLFPNHLALILRWRKVVTVFWKQHFSPIQIFLKVDQINKASAKAKVKVKILKTRKRGSSSSHLHKICVMLMIACCSILKTWNLQFIDPVVVTV